MCIDSTHLASDFGITCFICYFCHSICPLCWLSWARLKVAFGLIGHFSSIHKMSSRDFMYLHWNMNQINRIAYLTMKYHKKHGFGYGNDVRHTNASTPFFDVPKSFILQHRDSVWSNIKKKKKQKKKLNKKYKWKSSTKNTEQSPFWCHFQFYFWRFPRVSVLFECVAFSVKRLHGNHSSTVTDEANEAGAANTLYLSYCDCEVHLHLHSIFFFAILLITSDVIFIAIHNF